jgi:hypothetical protein
MTSEKKISANRKNAARSTGPKTAAGKQRSSRNALWHGLSTWLNGNDAYGKQIEAQASQLRDSLGVPHEIACVVAEAQVALTRVQRATVATINRRVHEQSRNDEASMPDESRVGMATLASLTELIAFRRYETRAISRFKRTLRQVENFERLHAVRPPAPRVLPNVTTDRGAGESRPIHLKVTPRPTRKISLEYHANLTRRAFRCCSQLRKYTTRLVFKSEDEKLKAKKEPQLLGYHA